jgi:hypothetical protein
MKIGSVMVIFGLPDPALTSEEMFQAPSSVLFESAVPAQFPTQRIPPTH